MRSNSLPTSTIRSKARSRCVLASTRSPSSPSLHLAIAAPWRGHAFAPRGTTDGYPSPHDTGGLRAACRGPRAAIPSYGLITLLQKRPPSARARLRQRSRSSSGFRFLSSRTLLALLSNSASRCSRTTRPGRRRAELVIFSSGVAPLLMCGAHDPSERPAGQERRVSVSRLPPIGPSSLGRGSRPASGGRRGYEDNLKRDSTTSPGVSRGLL